MARISDELKERRKERIWLIVRQHNGIRQKEISELSGFENRTVNNYLTELEFEGKVYKEGVLWFNNPDYQGTRLRQFTLVPEEAYTLYLAARLFVKQSDKRNEYAESALYRLAEELKSDIPVDRNIREAAQKLAEREDKPGYHDTFQTLIRAYLNRHKVRLIYKPLWRDSFETTFEIYLIEPSAIGFSTYVIGYSSLVGELRSYKLSRIEAVEILRNETYAIPEDFPGLSIFDTAWSVITGEETTRVVLRFSDSVAQRVLETNWHPSQGYAWDEEKKGYLRWWVDVADTTDIAPWIRSWGRDVEVLEPEDLRKSMKTHIWKLTQIYNLNTQSDSTDTQLLRLWGKTTKDPNLFHPALYHMFDVAHVAQQLLSPRASSRWRRVLADALNAEADSLYEWLPYLIALHDIGKISVPFQILNDRQAARLKDEGFDLGQAQKADGQELHHSIVGRILLKETLAEWPENLAAAFQEMVSGHHGIFQQDTTKHRRDFGSLQEVEVWFNLRQRAIATLQSYLLQQWPEPLPNPTNQSTAMMALNGFCILCDWLGSDADYFTPAPLTPLAEYVLQSREQAYKRVKEAGFFEKAVTTAPTQFAELFKFAPRPLQAAIDTIPDSLLKQPTLTIIEGPTGEGKTEADLLLARRIGALRGTDEMYIALPTTATSNAMHERVQEHVEQRLGLPKELVRLVHGQDFLKEDDLAINPLESVEPGQDTPSESPALSWFAPKKKALLAPIGVGTIDQAELSALNVRHNALRMMGLAGKTVILDEVHAYDTYMTTIIKRMLTWLSALGSSVILLSATLPKARRQELVEAFVGNKVDLDVDLEAYPSILTIGPAGYHLSTPPAYQPGKSIQLILKPFAIDDTKAKAEWLLDQVQNGGCACWMTNTVKRAQQIYKHLLELAPPEVELNLLHARFPLAERKKREKAIMDKYSKKEKRPAKGIVVGTQVLEQSLDLDFDVLMTDLAPIDLVLQRAGRLHRHEREAKVRGDHQAPKLYINTSLDPKADPRIYAEYILEKSRQALTTRQTITLPLDYRPLIEAVYDETIPAADDPLYDLWLALQQQRDTLKVEARQRLTNRPKADDPFYWGGKFKGFTDDEEGSSWFNMKTRWGQESVTVIPLSREDELAHLLDRTISAPLNKKAPRDTQLALLRQGIRVSQPYLIAELRKSTTPLEKLFTDSALLKNCLPLWLEPSADGTGFESKELELLVRLDSELGLVIGALD
ncbi:MAG: CRISPR-associated helicase Cas3' [Anaerolineae bacterium]|nr:CRISPR-associated helicase Cas3' [Anaerolineae bacterium]